MAFQVVENVEKIDEFVNCYLLSVDRLFSLLSRHVKPAEVVSDYFGVANRGFFGFGAGTSQIGKVDMTLFDGFGKSCGHIKYISVATKKDADDSRPFHSHEECLELVVEKEGAVSFSVNDTNVVLPVARTVVSARSVYSHRGREYRRQHGYAGFYDHSFSRRDLRLLPWPLSHFSVSGANIPTALFFSGSGRILLADALAENAERGSYSYKY